MPVSETTPCPRCGGVVAYSNGQCKPCKRAGIKRYQDEHPEMVRNHANKKAMRHFEEGSTIRQRHPPVRRAQNTVSRALQAGLLVRPTTCSKCDIPCKPDAAHLDYTKPLEVVWLCRPCHSVFDWAQPKRPF